MNSVRAFISSPRQGLEAHRDALVRRLRRIRVEPREMEAFGARPGSPLDESLREIEACDVIIVLFSDLEGTTIPNTRETYCQAEYSFALKRGKQIFLYESATRDSARPHWQRDALERHVRDTFVSPEDLSAKVVSDVARWLLWKVPWYHRPGLIWVLATAALIGWTKVVLGASIIMAGAAAALVAATLLPVTPIPRNEGDRVPAAHVVRRLVGNVVGHLRLLPRAKSKIHNIRIRMVGTVSEPLMTDVVAGAALSIARPHMSQGTTPNQKETHGRESTAGANTAPRPQLDMLADSGIPQPDSGYGATSGSETGLEKAALEIALPSRVGGSTKAPRLGPGSGDSDARRGLDSDLVLSYIRKQGPGLKGCCYEWRGRVVAEETLVFEYIIAPSGKILSLKAIKKRNEEIAQCLQTRMTMWRFPASSEGVAVRVKQAIRVDINEARCRIRYVFARR